MPAMTIISWRDQWKITPPCGTHCDDRHIGCHSQCRKYTEYKAKMDELYAKERATRGAFRRSIQ